MSLRDRKYLVEMAMVPSLKQLQQKGNRKPASKKELQNARKRALKCKTAVEARNKAKYHWELMEKQQIIQVFLDREAELINPKRPVPKPLFMDKKIVKWSQLNKAEKQSAVNWLAGTKTEIQMQTLVKKAKAGYARKKTPDSKDKVTVYNQAMKQWQKNQVLWRKTANTIRIGFV